jgi:hypothetical protein
MSDNLYSYGLVFFKKFLCNQLLENILALDTGLMMFSIPVFHIRDVNGVTAKQQPEVSFSMSGSGCLQVTDYFSENSFSL